MIKSIINNKVRVLEVTLREDYPEMYQEFIQLYNQCKYKALQLLTVNMEINIWTAAKLGDYIEDYYIDDREINPEWIPVPKPIAKEDYFEYDPNVIAEQNEPEPSPVNNPLALQCV